MIPNQRIYELFTVSQIEIQQKTTRVHNEYVEYFAGVGGMVDINS